MDKEDRKHSPTHESSQQKKCKFRKNQDTAEYAASSTDTSVRDNEIPMSKEQDYCFINFYKVFSAISTYVICRNCGNDIQFQNAVPHGLGFKLILKCKCGVKYINSCSLINGEFEINRRIIFAMRILGVGWNGLNLFCVIMDLGSVINKTLYYSCLHIIYEATTTIYNKVIATAVEEKTQKNNVRHNEPLKWTVSGNWVWKTRNFSDSFGVATIIGNYSKKVLDAEIKSNIYDNCSPSKRQSNIEASCKWLEDDGIYDYHECDEKIAIDAIKEIFSRLKKKYGVKYITYIGDGKSKFFKVISNMTSDIKDIVTKECIVNVEKRMRAQLQNVIKNNENITAKVAEELKSVIDDLTLYYGLALKRNSDSVQNMKNAIWATYYHICSSDENPQHQFCPAGPDSWCKWRKAEYEGTLDTYEHEEPPLNKDILSMIKPIYEDFTSDNLLEKCLGANILPIKDENLHLLLWTLSSKCLYSGKSCFEIAVYLAICIFNEGYHAILQIMVTMGIVIGQGTVSYVIKIDQERNDRSKRQIFDVSQEIENINATDENIQQFFEQEIDILYGH